MSRSFLLGTLPHFHRAFDVTKRNEDSVSGTLMDEELSTILVVDDELDHVSRLSGTRPLGRELK